MASTFLASVLLLPGCGGGGPEPGEGPPDTSPMMVFEAGKARGSSVKEVRFVGDTLMTLSDVVETWSLTTGGGVDAPAAARSYSKLHVSPSRGLVGLSEGGRAYASSDAEDPLFEAKGSGYLSIAYVEGWDRFASFGTKAVKFFERETGAFVKEHAVPQGIEGVIAGEHSYATSIPGGRIALWPIGANGAKGVLTGHEAKVVAMAYSPDETLFASASADGLVIVWDVATAKEQARFDLPLSPAVPAANLAFLPGRPVLAAQGNGRETSRLVHFVSVVTGETIETFRVGSTGVLDMDVSPDGSMLAVGCARSGQYTQNQAAEDRKLFSKVKSLESGLALVFDVSSVGR